MPEIENNVGNLRRARGYSVIELAKMVDVSRQTVYAIESGGYVPNTAVALRLARALVSTVEELFSLPADAVGPEFAWAQATLLPDSGSPQPGQPVQLCQVDRKLVAAAPSPVRWYFSPSDGVVDERSEDGRASAQHRTKVRIFHSGRESSNRILVAGCDPGISVLARHALAAGVELVLANRNSSQALSLLKNGCVHVAGTHLGNNGSGDSNIPAIGRLFPRKAVAVISFAIWEEGILIAQGNPKAIQGVEDFARPDVLMVNREEGSGSRLLLDSHMKRMQIDARNVRGYDATAPGHLPAAWQVASGSADCCIATRAAARAFGLGFIPLASERYDFAIRRRHFDLPRIQTLLDVMSRSVFRRELAGLGGYDTTVAGQQLL